MNTEVKKVSDSWEAKCNSTVEWMSCGERLLEIDGILQECDAILQEVGLGTGFISKRTELEGLLEDKRVLWEYVPMLPDFVNYYLDEPLYKAFNQHATETISRIKLEDFWVDAGENNQIGITESYYDPYLGEYKGSENKTRFTFVDFLGTNTETAHLPNSSGWIVSTSGCVEDFARIFEGQYEAMNAAEMFKETEITSYEEYLEHFAHQGEFNHTMDKPFLSFVSSVLDITIIKPIIEACTGEDLITGEDLSDLERGLKVVFAIVDLVTLGGAVAATKCSEMELKKALQVLGKTVAIEFAGNTAACGVSAIGEAFDWPIPITIMLSLAAGIAVSCKGNKLLFEGEGFSREVLLDDTEVKQIGEMFESGLNSYEVVGNTKDFYRKNPSDPIRDVLGSGLESNPNEWDKLINEMEKNGVEIVYRDGTMAYSPGLVPGTPGQLIIDKNASMSALIHEYQHYLDDVTSGLPGMRQLYEQNPRIIKELRAYMKEIKIADELGLKDVSAQLWENYRQEREYILNLFKE